MPRTNDISRGCPSSSCTARIQALSCSPARVVKEAGEAADVAAQPVQVRAAGADGTRAGALSVVEVVGPGADPPGDLPVQGAPHREAGRRPAGVASWRDGGVVRPGCR